MIIDTPGVYDGIPDEAYHRDPVPGGSLSSTGARRILDCPARFRYERDHPVFKDVFDFGSAAHRLVLGAGAELVVIDADSWRTKAAKEERDAARAEGRAPVLAHEHAVIEDMAAAIRAHPLANILLDPECGGKPEQSLFWPDAETGVWLRARPDWLPSDDTAPGRMIITDYKTADSASPASFARSAANLGYFQQDAWYLDGVRALGVADDPAFLFVVQERQPPYLVTICELDEPARQAGRERNRRAIERFRDCTEAGVWPGYSDDVELISLPAWATRTEEYA